MFVIDSKHHEGKKVRVETPLLGKARLMVGGRDQTKLADGLSKQVDIVPTVVQAGVPVSGAFCFVDADLPLLSTPRIRRLPIFGRRGLAKHINRAGALSDDQIRAIATELAPRLPAA